jgi:hypothetical protein
MAFRGPLLIHSNSKLVHSSVPTRNLRHLLHLQQNLILYQHSHRLTGSCICVGLLKLKPPSLIISSPIHRHKLLHHRCYEEQILRLSLLSHGNTAHIFNQLRLAIQTQPVKHLLHLPLSKSCQISSGNNQSLPFIFRHFINPAPSPEHMYFHGGFHKTTHSLILLPI